MSSTLYSYDGYHTCLRQMLVGTSRACPVIGPHWEQIGFQGVDPRTDINRSMKMLAALQAWHGLFLLTASYIHIFILIFCRTQLIDLDILFLVLIHRCYI